MIKLGESSVDEAMLTDAGAPGKTDAPLAATPIRSKRDAAGQQFFSFDFTRRNRRLPRDAVNALLSLDLMEEFRPLIAASVALTLWSAQRIS
jgi:hypothetical protein